MNAFNANHQNNKRD
ncbi:hypothetical protein D039_3292B, partial [Vibrio parahaemolyticus EKP-028]